MQIRRLVVFLSALGLSLALFGTPAFAAPGPNSPTLTLTVRDQQGQVLGRLHPTAFHFLDTDSLPLPEGQLIARTHAGAIAFSFPGTVTSNLLTLGKRWGSATLRIKQSSSSFIKVKLLEPVVTSLSFPPGKTSLTVEYASLSIKFCGRAVLGGPVSCH
jgi:hypothetical protein